jgi:hypothetical protein
MPLDLLERPRPFPTLDRAFDAVERALARLGIEDPASLPSPQLVEEDLSPTALPAGTVLVLNPDEYVAAEVDIHDTVLDERLGGTVYGTIERPPTPDERRRRLREMGGAATAFGFLPPGAEPYGTGRVRQVRSPAFLAGYRFLVADVPGFRVALISRALPGGGFLALWSGDGEVVDEITRVFQRALQVDGHAVPARAPAVPTRDVVPSSAALWKQAEELRAYRTVREAELRQIARAAALRGVELRREREADSRAAS